MAARLDIVTPRVQAINNDPMATCTGHFTAGGSVKFEDNRWVCSKVHGLLLGSHKEFVAWGTRFSVEDLIHRISVAAERKWGIPGIFQNVKNFTQLHYVRCRHLHVSELERSPPAPPREHDHEVQTASGQLAQADVETRFLLQERQKGHLPRDDHP
ncbi:hypothetical protein TNCV_1894501 [Trichonephila clavipes]|nr:hypothetical protein TNCV_1894501 [Trichonephila clavipes]